MMERKKQQGSVRHYCRECAHATDFHEKNLNGDFFMCKCEFHKWSKFLNHDCCEHFRIK